MQEVYAWGLEVIRSFQSVQSPFLTFLVKGITFFGDPVAYILILPVIFWCVDEKKGFRLAMICLFSAAFNTIIKGYLAVPRPFVRAPSVGMMHPHGYSTPSGHAQGSATFWITGALLLPQTAKKNSKLFRICLAVLPPLLIGLSRVYLGVHYPTDVFLGWILGSALVAAGFFLFPLIEQYIAPLSRSFKILIIAVLIFCMNALYKTDTSMPAAIFGLASGYILLCDTGGFSAVSGSLLQKIMRVLLGFAGISVIYFGLKMLSPAEADAQYSLFRFISYAAIGFWAGFAVPKLSIALKLAHGNQKQDNVPV